MANRVTVSVQNFWRNLGTARLPFMILFAVLVALIAALTALLVLRAPHAPSTELVASIVVPVEREDATPKEETFAPNASAQNGAALSPAPDQALLEDNPVGPLPKRSANGRAPWQVYARPFDDNSSASLVAIIVTDMGLSAAATEQAIHDLPPDVTFAFSPYAERLSTWTDKARQLGFETLLQLPLEPTAYPQNDPGPETLLTSLSADENMKRLYWTLSRVGGPIGVLNKNGDKFVATDAALQPVLKDLNTRGLAFIDDGTSNAPSAAALIAGDLKLPYARSGIMLDQIPSRDAIQSQLNALVTQAKTNGSAIGTVSPSPLALEQIKQFAAHASGNNVVIVPVSAIIAKNSDASPKPIAAPALAPVAAQPPPSPTKLFPTPAISSIAPQPKDNAPDSAIAPTPAPAEDDPGSMVRKNPAVNNLQNSITGR